MLRLGPGLECLFPVFPPDEILLIFQGLTQISLFPQRFASTAPAPCPHALCICLSVHYSHCVPEQKQQSPTVCRAIVRIRRAFPCPAHAASGCMEEWPAWAVWSAGRSGAVLGLWGHSVRTHGLAGRDLLNMHGRLSLLEMQPLHPPTSCIPLMGTWLGQWSEVQA